MKNQLTNAKIIGVDVENSDYKNQAAQRGDPLYIMSRSELKQFSICPHRWRKGYQDDSTKATDWGSLIDCMVLQPHLFNEQFVVTPGNYQSKGMQCPECQSITDSATCRKCKTDRIPIVIEKPWDWNASICQQWRDEREGLTPVKLELHHKALKAVDEIFSDRQLAEIIQNSKKQVMWSAEYFDSATEIKVPLTGLIDIVPDLNSEWGHSLFDFKTANNAAPFNWKWVVADRWYDAQAALYLDAWRAATGEERENFCHIIQESFEPFEIGKRILSGDFLEMGREKYLTALQRYCQCRSKNEWPGYDDDHSGTVINGFTITEPDAKMLMKGQL